MNIMFIHQRTQRAIQVVATGVFMNVALNELLPTSSLDCGYPGGYFCEDPDMPAS